MSDVIMELQRQINDLRRQVENLSAGQAVPASTLTSYTPTWTASTTNPTLGNGTLEGYYIRRGKMCLVIVYLSWGSTTTGGTGDWSFALPFTAATSNVSWLGLAHLRDAGTNNYMRAVRIEGGASVMSIFLQLDAATNVSTVTASAPFTWTNTDVVRIQVEYETA